LRNPATPYRTNRIKAEDNAGFVFVGRLEADKGALALAQSAQRTGSTVTFIGEGVLRAELESRFPQFPVSGWKTPDEIGKIAAGMRALVMPSLHPEPFAMVLPEAIHSGLPVLVAHTALLASEIVTRGFGLVFDPKDDTSFDAALTDLTTATPDRLRAMSERGFECTVRLASTVDEWTSGLVDAYRGAVLGQQTLR